MKLLNGGQIQLKDKYFDNESCPIVYFQLSNSLASFVFIKLKSFSTLLNILVVNPILYSFSRYETFLAILLQCVRVLTSLSFVNNLCCYIGQIIFLWNKFIQNSNVGMHDLKCLSPFQRAMITQSPPLMVIFPNLKSAFTTGISYLTL